MGMIDLYEDLLLDAEAEGNRDLWLRPLQRPCNSPPEDFEEEGAYWTEEAVRCITSADPEAEEEFQGLLRYSVWRALDEVVEAFERKYFTLDEVLD